MDSHRSRRLRWLSTYKIPRETLPVFLIIVFCQSIIPIFSPYSFPKRTFQKILPAYICPTYQIKVHQMIYYIQKSLFDYNEIINVNKIPFVDTKRADIARLGSIGDPWTRGEFVYLWKFRGKFCEQFEIIGK